MSARDERGIEIRLLGRRITPVSLLRPERGPFLERVSSFLIDRRNDLVYRRVSAVRPARAVVEDQDMSFARQTAGNPVRIVLGEELLIGDRPRPVDAGIAPAVEQVAAFAALAAGVTGRLGRRGAVVEDPDLAEIVNAHQNLVKLGVIGHGVEVVPVRVDPLGPARRRTDVPDRLQLIEAVFLGHDGGHGILDVVDVNELGVGGHIAEIGLRRIMVLDQVVPEVPFPDDVAGGFSGRLDLDERVGQQIVADQIFLATRGDRLLPRSSCPRPRRGNCRWASSSRHDGKAAYR